MSMVRKIHCSVERITDHGDRVYTVELLPERPIPVFLPGQFLHLTVDEYDPSGFWPESRVFSIASSPREKGLIRIIYSVKGSYTSRVERELSVGRGVWVKLPYGEFVVDGGTDAVLIAGGTGITAFQAFIEGLLPDHPRKVLLLYGARRVELLLGRDLIGRQQLAVRNLACVYFAEATGVGMSPAREGIGQSLPAVEGLGVGGAILPGRIRLDVLDNVVLDPVTTYYLAGPPPMVSALTAQLGQRGVASSRIRVDAWE